jgi:hypothetical protein
MIEREAIKELSKGLTPTERSELVVKYNAYIDNLARARDAQDKSTLQALDQAKKSLSALLNDIESRNAGRAGDELFANLLLATQYLQKAGWRVAKTKVYKDGRAGKLRVNPDKTTFKSELDAYAHKYLSRSVVPDFDQVDDLLRIEKECQIQLLKTREKKLAFEADLAQGKYLDRDAVLLEWSVKLGLLEAYLKNAARTNAVEWTIAVKGDPDRADIMYGMIAAVVDAVLEQLADLQEIKVRVRRNTEAAT